MMSKFFFRWIFVIWFIIAAIVWYASDGSRYDEGKLISIIIVTFILVLPTMIVGQLYWIIGKFYVALYVLGGIFALSIDLLRMHIKKYREYKRIAMRAKKEA